MQELLGHPPVPEGHAAWIARIRKLAGIAGNMPLASQKTHAGQPKSIRAPEAQARSHGATSPVQPDPRATNRERACTTTQRPATKIPEKSSNSCQILHSPPDARP